jgi:deoxyinosine 3'endonuclease (endonuclease V)
MEDWDQYQLNNKNNIITYDDFNINNIKYIGGLDISFDKSNNKKACAYLTIYDFNTFTIVYEDYNICELEIPYISGYLGFRETPQYKILLNKCKNTTYYPDILMIDGCGILHHKEFGSASQLGYELNIPTIGVSKTLLCIDGLSEHTIKKQFTEKCIKKGDFINIIGNSNKTLGAALKSSNNATNPIYVSIGHKISLETAIKIVTQTCIYKNPEPIRNSDIKSKLYFKF